MNQSIKTKVHTYSNCLLIASDQMRGGFFDRKVVYLLDHGEEGALGVTINLPIHSLKSADLLKYFGLEEDKSITLNNQQLTVYQGGPVHTERGFILHDGSNKFKSTMKVMDGLSLTTSEDMLKAIFNGTVWQQHLLAFGYSGWSKQQLDEEILQGLWHIAPLNKQVVFEAPANKKWEMAMNSLNVNPDRLMVNSGHA